MAKISYYRNDATGSLDSPHRIGEDEQGRALYSAQEGWTPVDDDGNEYPNLSCDEDGNWFLDDEAGTKE